MSGVDIGWTLLREAARLAPALCQQEAPATFAVTRDGLLVPRAPADTTDRLRWQPGLGWQAELTDTHPAHALLDLYLPICSATAARPLTIGHLGQSLDGFIATPGGDSQFVTGEANIVHLHRLRALCDAVVIGAGTAVADNPQLTTRLVDGPNPLRVVFDPGARLERSGRLFTDGAAPTLLVRGHGASAVTAAAPAPGVEQVLVDTTGPDGGVAALVTLLRTRGCARIFVEGGGVTVSAFLAAGQLDRLHLAVAPLLIGNGRPAVRLEARTLLRECLRPACRVYRMGRDLLFDCDLRTAPEPDADPHALTRVL